VTEQWWARPLVGARLALATVLALWPGLSRAAVPDLGPLPWRVAGRVGFTVDAASFPDSAGTTLDVYVRISPTTLASLTRDEGGLARLRLNTRLRGAFGGTRVQEQTQEFAIGPQDSAGGMGKVVALRFPVKPGRYRLLVRIEDVQSRKRGLLYTVRAATESGHVEGEVAVPGPVGARELSDLEFVWTSRSGGPPTTFERGGRTLLPNPERLYGLYGSELRAAFTAMGDGARPWHWRTRVRDAARQVVADRESTAAPQRWLHGAIAADLSTEPAGGYDLELEVWEEGDTATLQRRAQFSVGWQVDSWLRNPRDIQDDVHFLLAADDEEAFALLSPGEQERYLDEFWRVRDPSPGTGENEARAAFFQRVAHANQHFSHPGIGKGMFSDMGRVYIRYGEPSEIVNQVIPTGDDTVDEVIQQLLASEDRPVGDVPSKGPGGDLRPFELWRYEGPIGLPPDADPRAAGHPRRKHLVFLFVDERGTGDYRLRYSTE
jgi:GWxTD domain-containing protein